MNQRLSKISGDPLRRLPWPDELSDDSSISRSVAGLAGQARPASLPREKDHADRRSARPFFEGGRFRADFHEGAGHPSAAPAAGRNFRPGERSARAGNLVRPGRGGAGPIARVAAVARIAHGVRRRRRRSIIPPPAKLSFSAFDLGGLKRERRACRHGLSCAFIPSSRILSPSVAARSGRHRAAFAAASVYVLVTRMKLDSEVLNLLPAGSNRSKD